MNKLRSLISILLILCLSVTSILPVTVFAGRDASGAPGAYSGGGGGGGGTGYIKDKQGGYRFSLLFLSGDIGGTSILDSVGNVNIDKWEEYRNDVQVVGSLDVYYPGYDSRDYYSYGKKDEEGISSFFIFDVQGYNRSSYKLSGSQRNMASSDDLHLSDFPWKYNVNIGSATSIGDILVKPVAGETVKLELYPNNPESQRVVDSQKYELTEDCAKIIDELCRQSGLSGDEIVYCETARGEDSTKKNIFEQGTFNGANGSYRLMIEPYEILSPDNGAYWAMTLRDCIWYFRNKTGSSTANGSFAYNLGNYLCLMTNLVFMPHKDILGLNAESLGFNFESGKTLENYTNKLKTINYCDRTHSNASEKASCGKLHGSITKFIRNAVEKTEGKYGYGIGSISSEMVKTKIQEMFIGSISNVFLPGTLQDGTGLNKEVKSYSIEYRGDKQSQDKLKDYQTELVKSLKTSIEGEISRDVTTAEEIIENNQLSSLDDSTYKNLLENVQKQLEESYPVTIYGNSVKAVTTDIFENSSFKTFITSMYNQIITQSHTGSDGTVLMDTVFFMLF